MSAARMLVFLVLLVAVLGGINAAVFRWARNAFKLGPGAQRGLKLVLVAAFAGMVLGRVAGRFWSGAALKFVIATASTVELAVVISGILLLMADGVRLLLSLPGRFRSAPVVPASPGVVPPVTVAELPRRAFLAQVTAGSAFLIGSSSSLYGALKGRYDYSVEEIVVKIPGLPRALDGFSIAQLSDVHIGVFVGDPELKIAEELLRQAKPDLIVLTGDLLDNDPRLAGQLGRFVRRLPGLARRGRHLRQSRLLRRCRRNGRRCHRSWRAHAAQRRDDRGQRQRRFRAAWGRRRVGAPRWWRSRSRAGGGLAASLGRPRRASRRHAAHSAVPQPVVLR
jgi:uncharacterized protein